MSDTPALTVFYDGHCPLCVTEMRHLARFDHQRLLHLQDLHAPGFRQRYPHIDPVAADRILHGQRADGTLLYGLDVTCLAWRLVGRHRWLQVLRWPGIRWVADRAYLGFARYRQGLAYLLTGQARCERCDLSRDQACDR